MKVLWIKPRNEDQAGDCLLSEMTAVRPVTVSSGVEALQALRREPFEAAVINSPTDGWATDELLEGLLRVRPGLQVLIRARGTDMVEAVRLTKLGAFHFVDDRAPATQVRALLETARRISQPCGLSTSEGLEPWRQLLIGDSPAMRDLRESIRLLGPRKCTVLITGETGTGKELVARALHLASNRAAMPLVAVNCTALPENLLEAELFGHVKGAFTGAVASRAGRFEQANRSTLFLDEIADMPFELQGKLLRVLQEREFQRLGSSETVRVDVRVVAACNVDLEERARLGRFREDLYYRLNVIPIHTPPLRDRLEDIPLLVQHFIRKVALHENLPMKHVTLESLERLMEHSWPGNVRQLENAVEMAIILSGERTILFPADFRLASNTAPRRLTPSGEMPEIAIPDHGLDFERTVGRIELDLLEQALRKTHGNKKQAAEMLGLKRTTLAAKLKSLESLVC